MKPSSSKGNGKTSFVLSCIFTVFATIALIFYIIFFANTLLGISASAQGGGLSAGLQAAFSMILCLIFASALLACSTFGLMFSIIAARRTVSKIHTTSTVLWILHAAYLFFAVMGLIILILFL